jgi:Mrp family chromosome partitioning ATPase
VDGALMVVRAGYTPKPAIENALRAFDSSRLLGVVLNESGLEDDYRYEAVTH